MKFTLLKDMAILLGNVCDSAQVIVQTANLSSPCVCIEKFV